MTDQEMADAASQLAGVIMRVTEEHTTEPRVAVSALWRCVAGFYARLALEAGDPTESAVMAIVRNAADAALIATRLLDEMRRQRGG